MKIQVHIQREVCDVVEVDVQELNTAHIQDVVDSGLYKLVERCETLGVAEVIDGSVRVLDITGKPNIACTFELIEKENERNRRS